MSESTGPYLDIHALCKLLGCSQVTAYRLLKKRHRNSIPAYRIGGKWKFLEEEIREWVRDTRR